MQTYILNDLEENMQNVMVIGIAGGSGSGKTTLSQKIKAGRAFRERDSLAKAFGKVAVKSIV